VSLAMTQKSILFCYAHPDDEVGIVSLANRYMQEEGARTTLICTTNGDLGTVDPEHLRGYSSIPELRLAELACATSAAGFTEVVTFGYRDSGMMGTDDNQHPDSFWGAPLEMVIERVAEVMRRVRPQVVVTFNTFGAYGHPDHIKINQATVAAFTKLRSESGEHPEKLYYATGPNRLFRVGIALMRLRGQDPRHSGRNKDVDLIAALEATTPVTTRIKATRYLEPSWRALECYASQIQLPPLVRRFRRLLARMLQGTVALSRVYPEWHPGDKLERDIFEGISEPQLENRQQIAGMG
jgi:LmbE family N-acetylglucosaminyl deacetylase